MEDLGAAVDGATAGVVLAGLYRLPLAPDARSKPGHLLIGVKVPIAPRVQAYAIPKPSSQDPLEPVLRSLGEATHHGLLEETQGVVIPEM